MIESKRLKTWLRVLGYPQRERPPRRNPTGLSAIRGGDTSSKLGPIKVISRTGFFLETEERWPIGDIISLTVQRDDAPEGDSESRMDVQVRVASHGEGGVGMEFLLPKGMNESLWEHYVDTADTPIETEDAQFLFRMLRALLFLYRLCPSRTMEPISVLTGQMDQFRTGSMLTITSTAEKMLAEQPDAEEMRADPDIVAGILKSGSWQSDEVTQRLWAGLLASSCDKDGHDVSNQDLIEVFVEVTANQARILLEGCRRFSEQIADDDGSAGCQVIITNDEMINISGMYDFYRNATDVAYLHTNGLLKATFDFSTHNTSTSFNITPSPLGMRLFKACRGYLLESSKAHA